MILMQEGEDDSDFSNGQWSQSTYSDVSGSPSPPSNTLPTSHYPPVKRKATISLDKQKDAKKGTTRIKPTTAIAPEIALIMLKLPEVRQCFNSKDVSFECMRYCIV